MRLKEDTTLHEKEEIALGTAWPPQRCCLLRNFFQTTFIVVALLLFSYCSVYVVCAVATRFISYEKLSSWYFCHSIAQEQRQWTCGGIGWRQPTKKMTLSVKNLNIFNKPRPSFSREVEAGSNTMAEVKKVEENSTACCGKQFCTITS